MRIITVFLTMTLAGCSGIPQAVFTGSSSCNAVGCETGGPVIYPHEKDSGVNLHRRWYGVNGELPSDYPAGSLERKRLRQQQIRKLESIGLGPQGRPLDE